MKLVSLFAGAGGEVLGAHRAGLEHVEAVEWDLVGRSMTRGGRRPGAGRPKAQHPRRPVSVSLSAEELQQLDALREDGESRSECVRRLIRETGEQHD